MLIRTTLIRNFQKTATRTRVRSFHMDGKPVVGSTRTNTPGLVHGLNRTGGWADGRTGGRADGRTGGRAD